MASEDFGTDADVAPAAPNFADGAWIHVRIEDGAVRDVIRPEDLDWHAVTDLLIAAWGFARGVERGILGSLYDTVTALGQRAERAEIEVGDMRRRSLLHRLGIRG